MSAKVSIGMPVYNGALTLEATIQTILNQKFSDFELIISDDCSKDNTQEICEKFQKLDSRIKYFRQDENFGMPVKNFQFVLDKAEGEFFMFASHDDPYHPEFIESMLEVMEFDKKCIIAFSDYSIANASGNEKILITPSSSCSKSKVARYLSRIIDFQPALIYGLFRKKYFTSNDLKLFDFFEVSLGLRMAIKGNIRIVNKDLWSWNIDGQRKSHSIYPLGFYLRDLLGLKRKKKKVLVDHAAQSNRRFSETQMEDKFMNYLPFYFSQLKLIFKSFSLLKSLIISIPLTYYVLGKIVYLFIKPRGMDIDFDDPENIPKYHDD
tara:strand:+ start:174 stop:1139 length:966 start_codon:yes stop_codon:yes gene_type:complete